LKSGLVTGVLALVRDEHGQLGGGDFLGGELNLRHIPMSRADALGKLELEPLLRVGRERYPQVRRLGERALCVRQGTWQTRIAKSNQGKFPSKKVAEIIDGRAAVAAHGAKDMPVWGDRYRVATKGGESPKVVEQRARAGINALVRYLEAIQE
jgi:hypothetical protein